VLKLNAPLAFKGESCKTIYSTKILLRSKESEAFSYGTLEQSA
jgi:hypothetical protein